MSSIANSIRIASLIPLFSLYSAVATAADKDWRPPIIARAVSWLIYDDWGHSTRAYGFERIRETAPNRQIPESLRKAPLLHVDASGWGGRQSFLYDTATKAVVPTTAKPETFSRSMTIRLSIQKQEKDYTAKVFWGNQLFFLRLQLKGDGAIVTEFTDHWLTLGKKPA
jgi:hypothetical protein